MKAKAQSNENMTTEIQWRRQWKPDLRSCPWQPITIDGESYLIKTKFTQDSYEILVTDLTNFWYEELDEKNLKKRVQKLNPSIEASVSRILDQIRNCLESPDNAETNLSIGFKAETDTEEDKMMLKLNSQLAGMPFTWHFIGKPAEKEMTSQHLIIPLMAMVGELMRRQGELVKVLETKDREIEDYKSQGVKTSRNNENNDDVDDGSLEENNRKSSSEPSWGTSRLPPSIAGSKSLSPEKSPKKSPAKSPRSSASNTPDVSPVKVIYIYKIMKQLFGANARFLNPSIVL
ncbi:hypothetical protein KUTeg_015093 [Tegillarca granosa]|uniref:Non-homologous end-joining factor 1 n=1 Tax=Tegillarca granosa TaxID=220873 RepID=A0ABQ9EP47_TEGGR|nr:hypothetical protein KUTeg_015093 [Tegillarca granosa]